MPILSDFWNIFQEGLFGRVENSIQEALTEKQEQLIFVLNTVKVEHFIHAPSCYGVGRKSLDRRLMARAFVLKAFYNISTTKMLIEMLQTQYSLRRICGYESRRNIPSEATFSRAFHWFASMGLGEKVLDACVLEYVGEHVVMHVSRDSTEVMAREKPTQQERNHKLKCKRGRPKKGDVRPSIELTRLEKQVDQTIEEAIKDLPSFCSVGCKKDAKGYIHCWTGWKAHIDWADGSIPLSVITTSACVHDSQVAIPLARMTANKATVLYELMDSAYDALQIREVCESLDHIAIIDPNKRGGKSKPVEAFRLNRFKERSTAERGNSRLKDDFGLRHLRVRGHAKAHLHIMFGILAVFADQYRHVFSG